MFLTENANNAENNVVKLQTAARSFLPFKPLKPSADSLPSFPIDCLPSRLRSYVEAVAIHTQTPVDMAAGAALGVLAACLQGKVKVEGNIGHYEQTSLYIFLIAPPGSRKSAVIHAMTAAIEDYEQKYNEENKAAMRRNRQKRESLQRDINRLTRQLEAKYDKLTELELQHTQDKLAELPEIKPLQIFTDDCTSESMVRLLRDETVEKALHVVAKLRKLSVTSICRSDLYQKCRGRFFRDVKDMEPVLTLLEQHGYIWMDIPTYSGVGRPSVGKIYVNPAALKDDFSA